MLKRLALLTASAIAVAASPSYAATYNLGTLTTTYSNTVDFTTTGTAINDTYNFSLPSSGTGVQGAVSNLFLQLPFVGTLKNITGLSGELFNSSNTSLGTFGSAGTTFSGLMGGAGYYAVVTGTTSGSFGGTYALGLTPVTTPTPGPLGFLVGAAGLAGIGLRNRKKKAVAA